MPSRLRSTGLWILVGGIAIAGAALGVFIGACGSGTDHEDKSSEAGELSEAELTTLTEDLPAAHCEKVFECCSVEQRAALVGVGSTVSECTASSAAPLSPRVLEYFEQSIDAGRLDVDNAQLESCIAQLRSASCETLREAYSPCRAFVPRVSEGGACSFDSADNECISGYCDASTADSDGMCVAGKEAGATCGADYECESDHCVIAEAACAPRPRPLCGSPSG